MNKYILVFIIILVESCMSPSTDKVKKHYTTIEINKDIKGFSFSKYFDSGELILLECESVGRIKRLFSINDKLIIQTSGKMLVSAYDTKLKTLKKLIRKGKGPKEILAVEDVFIDGKNIGVLDLYKKRILKIDLDGTHLNSHNVNDYFHDVIFISTNDAVLYKEVTSNKDVKQYLLTIFSLPSQKVKNQFLKIDPILSEERAFSSMTSLYNYNDTVCFFQVCSDTIYNVFPDRLEPRYILNYPKKEEFKNIYFNKSYDLRKFGEKLKESGLIMNINNFFESDHYVFFTYIQNGKVFLNFYNKTTKDCTTSSMFNDDFILGLNNLYISELFYPVYANKTHMYFLLEPYFLISEFKMLKTEQTEIWERTLKKHKEINSLLSDLSYDSNPIILKYRFKVKNR